MTRYSLQNSLATRYKKLLATRCEIRLLLVAEVAHRKNWLVTRCKICSQLVAKVACCRKSFVTHCQIRSLLVAKNHFFKKIYFIYNTISLSRHEQVYLSRVRFERYVANLNTLLHDV